MNSHPINLALRFLLEIAALVILGIWGWQRGDGWLRYILALGIPILVAILWATFRVPNDPGSAPIAIPGVLRLLFELALFAFVVWALVDLQKLTFAWILGLILVLHYAVSYDRIIWMVKQSL
jgi:xanthosine utilization system XapX-like protein